MTKSGENQCKSQPIKSCKGDKTDFFSKNPFCYLKFNTIVEDLKKVISFFQKIFIKFLDKKFKHFPINSKESLIVRLILFSLNRFLLFLFLKFLSFFLNS